MRSRSIPVLLFSLALLGIPVAVQAESYDPQFSLSLDLTGEAAFAAQGASSNYGLGGQFFADWRPLPFLSLGTGMDFTGYLSNGGWQAASWFLGGRIFPDAPRSIGELYLQGTAGLDLAPTIGSLMGRWPGNAHATAGVGYRFFLPGGNALDLGVQFDLYSPLSSPLTAFGLKAGYTWLFGGTPVEKEKAAPDPDRP